MHTCEESLKQVQRTDHNRGNIPADWCHSCKSIYLESAAMYRVELTGGLKKHTSEITNQRLAISIASCVWSRTSSTALMHTHKTSRHHIEKVNQEILIFLTQNKHIIGKIYLQCQHKDTRSRFKPSVELKPFYVLFKSINALEMTLNLFWLWFTSDPDSYPLHAVLQTMQLCF